MISNSFGWCYCSPIYSLLVGQKECVFAAHRDILSVSPVFARLCNGKSSEVGDNHVLLLPNDSAPALRIMLDYLYRGECGVVDIADMEADDATATSVSSLLAEVYVLAEKYELRELKVAILRKIKKHVGFANTPSIFFQMSRTIYNNTPESDSIFRTYFQTEVVHIVSSKGFGKALLELVAEAMMDGGSMARDMYLAHISWVKASPNMSSAGATALRKDLRETGDWKLSLKEYFASPWANSE